MKEQSKLPVTYVEWIDSQTTRGWIRFDPREDSKPASIQSVGVLVYENKESVSLSTSISSNGNHVDVITIPRCAIRKMKQMKVK